MMVMTGQKVRVCARAIFCVSGITDDRYENNPLRGDNGVDYFRITARSRVLG